MSKLVTLFSSVCNALYDTVSVWAQVRCSILGLIYAITIVKKDLVQICLICFFIIVKKMCL